MYDHVPRIAENIRRLAGEKKISISQLASRAGISRSTLTEILSEYELTNPNVATLVKIAQTLGCTVSDLVGDAKHGEDRI